MMKSTVGVGIAMTQGSFNLTRTGHVGVDRDGNTEAASKHLVRFLKSSYVSMMAEDDEDDFATWVDKNREQAEEHICTKESMQQLQTWFCEHLFQI